MTALKPLGQAVLFAIIGFLIGGGLSAALVEAAGRDEMKEPVIAGGYLFALIGWLFGIGVWGSWVREWFGASVKPFEAHGWKRYFGFSTDHKVIGVQYGATMVVILLLAGALAMLMRVELADAESNLLSNTDYNTVMGLHGIMMIAVAVAALMGGFANYVMPLMIGADDVAFPRLNALSYWIVPPVAVLLIITPLFGGFDTGWTAYPPLASQGATGNLLFLMAFTTFGLSSILGGLNFIATIITMRAPGMTWSRMPVFVWAVFAASLISLTATQFVAYALLMVIFERVFGMHFFDGTIGGDAILFEHVFWFYSHPAVYVMILPAFGIELEILSHFARKPVFAYKWVVRAFFSIVALSFVVWAHHLFTSGMSGELHGPFMVLTELISIPTGVVFLAAIGTIWRGRLWLKTPMLFAMGVIANFLIGGLTGLYLADVVTDLNFQDTYFVVAHFHYTIVGGEIFAMMAAIYYWYPKITGRMYNETLGRIHFIGMFALYNITFIPMFIVGAEGMNRRVASYPAEFENLNMFITVAALLLGVAFLPFVYNMVNSWIRGQRAGDNPWGARTLEWQTSSPPPEENFETPPVVLEDPYGYGDPEAQHFEFPPDSGHAPEPVGGDD
ncbi:MAG: cbb3-type cytochrome c oxidase subunit I [Dehalococcoidia bacterium]|jgi:cytochrome c oxidase subunit 1|nr:cbb3-type cytochrome c oxidase subunit I [Dehalococcoidia bacterium]